MLHQCETDQDFSLLGGVLAHLIGNTLFGYAFGVMKLFSNFWLFDFLWPAPLRNSAIPQRDAYCGLRRDLFPAPNCTSTEQLNDVVCFGLSHEPRQVVSLGQGAMPKQGLKCRMYVNPSTLLSPHLDRVPNTSKHQATACALMTAHDCAKDPNSTSAKACNKNCCDDEYCSVWQFMRSLDECLKILSCSKVMNDSRSLLLTHHHVSSLLHFVFECLFI